MILLKEQIQFNAASAETLRKVPKNPKKYAPGEGCIMRIHRTFEIILDLSPAIQKDIITQPDQESIAY